MNDEVTEGGVLTTTTKSDRSRDTCHTTECVEITLLWETAVPEVHNRKQSRRTQHFIRCRIIAEICLVP